MTKSKILSPKAHSPVNRTSSFIRTSSFVIRHFSSHPLGDFDPEKVEAFGENTAVELAQGETGTAGGLVGFQDRTGFVESVERIRQFVEVIREQIRAVIVQDSGNDLGELREL